jgi:hypothetical protein
MSESLDRLADALTREPTIGQRVEAANLLLELRRERDSYRSVARSWAIRAVAGWTVGGTGPAMALTQQDIEDLRVILMEAGVCGRPSACCCQPDWEECAYL